MISGIKVEELIVGTGTVAERGKVVVVHLRSFLNRGEERLNTYAEGRPAHIHLGTRNAIAGLEQGIEGMRVGGRRELIISPHLAYGEEGVTGSIPPNAVMRFEVELLEVREPETHKPEDFPPGKQLIVHRPGDASRNLSHWQFGLHEDGRAGFSLQKAPPPGATWRHMRHQHVEAKFSPSEIEQMFQDVLSLPSTHADQILRGEDVYADMSEKANNVTRDCQTNTLCLSIMIWEKGKMVSNLYLKENSPALLRSRFYTLISQRIHGEPAK
jgi:hypothetical protein